jgi:hypothetical protein
MFILIPLDSGEEPAVMSILAIDRVTHVEPADRHDPEAGSIIRCGVGFDAETFTTPLSVEKLYSLLIGENVE